MKILRNKPLFRKGDILKGNTKKSKWLKGIKFKVLEFIECQWNSDRRNDFDCPLCTGHTIIAENGSVFHDIYGDFIKE